MSNSMNTSELTWIPADVTNDVEMLSWLEEQMAIREYENIQAMHELASLDEENMEPLWGAL